MFFRRVLLMAGLTVCLEFNLAAQDSEIALVGSITDSTGAVLSASEIEVINAKGSTKALSDSVGNYRVVLNATGFYIVTVRRDGFQKKTIRDVQIGSGSQRLDVTLQLSTVSTSLTVTLDDTPLLNTTDAVSLIQLSPAQIVALPSIGEQDIFRAFQLLPGVSGSNETSSGLFVRGGRPDQTLVEYDGFRAYGVDHLFGYFSAFNMDAVEKIELSKGGFEAKKGGVLSSLMNITGKNGKFERPEFNVGISLLSFQGQFQTPVVRNKATIIASFRKSFQGPLFNKILKASQASAGAPQGGPRGRPGFALFESQPTSGFYDANVKFLWKPSQAQTVTFSSFTSKDEIDNSRSFNLPTQFLDLLRSRGVDLSARGIDVNNPKVEIQDVRSSRNTGGSLQWAGQWNSRIRSNVSVGYSRFNDGRARSLQAGSNSNPGAEDNRLRDLTFRADLAITAGTWNTLELGAEATEATLGYIFRAGAAPPSGSTSSPLAGVLDQSGRSRTRSGFLQDRMILGRRILLVPGLRTTHYDRTDRTYLEPRMSAYVFLSSTAKLKVAGGRYHQFTNKVTREDLLQGNRAFWTAADGVRIPVSSNREMIVGGTLQRGSWLFDVEAYKKKLSGLSQFAPRFAVAASSFNYDNFFYHGDGHAEGVEVLLQKRTGRNTGWLSYTLSQVKESLPALVPREYFADHDQRHEVKLVGVHDIRRFKLSGWKLSGTWILASGKPYTAPAGTEPITLPFGGTFERVIAGEKNSSRLPPYHRMDLALTRELKRVGDGGKGIFGISVFNVYNRKNIWYKEFNAIAGQLTENNIRLMGRTLNIFFTVGSGESSW